MRVKQLIKSVLFPGGTQPRKVLFGAGSGLTIVSDPSDQTQRLLGLAELEVARQFVSFARRSRTFCDVGASDGWYCLVARKHNPHISIIALEPDDGLYALAKENFRLNNLVENDSIRWIKSFCGTNATKLDEALSKSPEPIFLKIDIEGAEMDALESGSKIISGKDCSLIIETHSSELEIRCKEWLESRGYRVRIIPQGIYRALVPELRPLAHNQWLSAARLPG